MPTLVVTVGPIASGKSTIAGGLGERFRACGRRVAMLDLDDVVPVALERVKADPERMLSSYPDVLKATDERVDELLPTMPPGERTFDTTTTDPATIVDELARSILG